MTVDGSVGGSVTSLIVESVALSYHPSRRGTVVV